MSTNYPGDPLATEAPAAQPAYGVLPIARIPADGEADNVASISQFVKAAFDYMAWLMKPVANVAVWAQPTWGVQTPVNGWRRFTLDHFGFQSWGIQSIREIWNTDENVGGASSNGDYAKLTIPWHWVVVGTGGITAGAPNPSAPAQSPHFRTQLLSVSAGNGESTELRTPNSIAIFDTGNTISMEWAANIDAIGANNITWLAGLNGTAFFRKKSTDTNWQCVTNNGTETVVDSGYTPTANVFDRFRVVWSGSAVDDSGASRVLFFINGSLKANIITTLPIGVPASAQFNGTQTAASVARRMSIGPAWVTTNDGPLSF